jgi:hypothetical protein
MLAHFGRHPIDDPLNLFIGISIGGRLKGLSL